MTSILIYNKKGASNGSKVTITKSISGKTMTIKHKAKLKASTKYKIITPQL